MAQLHGMAVAWFRQEDWPPRELAEQRFLTAKRAFHEATEAITHQELGAVLRADQALIELNQARAALAALDAAILRSLLTRT